MTVREVRFQLRSDLQLPRTLHVKTSSDGTTWATVATKTYANAGVEGTTWHAVPVDPVAARYVRLETGADGTYEASGAHFVVREIQLWG